MTAMVLTAGPVSRPHAPRSHLAAEPIDVPPPRPKRKSAAQQKLSGDPRGERLEERHEEQQLEEQQEEQQDEQQLQVADTGARTHAACIGNSDTR